MRRKRVLTLIAVFAVIGAVVNFAIAQCAGWCSSVGPKERYFFIPYKNEAAEVSEQHGLGRTEYSWRLLPEGGAAIWQDIRLFGPKGKIRERSKPDYSPLWVMPPWSILFDHQVMTKYEESRNIIRQGGFMTNGPRDIALGLPLRSFVASHELQLVTADWRKDPPFVVHGGYVRRDPTANMKLRALAWKPIFPNVLLSSLVWGTAAFVCYAIPASLRRNLRRRKGLCIYCGYDVSAGISLKCPECGK